MRKIIRGSILFYRFNSDTYHHYFNHENSDLMVSQIEFMFCSISLISWALIFNDISYLMISLISWAKHSYSLISLAYSQIWRSVRFEDLSDLMSTYISLSLWQRLSCSYFSTFKLFSLSYLCPNNKTNFSSLLVEWQINLFLE